MQEIWLWFLVREDPLGKGMATHPLLYSCLENPMDRGAWQGCKESDMNEWLTLSLLHLYILQGEKVWDFSLRLGICLQIWGFQYEHLPENAAETHPWSSMVHRACPGRTCARARVLCHTWASAPWRMGFLCSLWWCVGRERRGGWKVSGRAPVGEGSCTNRENTDNWVWRVRGCLRKTRLTKGVLALNWHLVNARCLLPLGTECALSLSLGTERALSLSLILFLQWDDTFYFSPMRQKVPKRHIYFPSVCQRQFHQIRGCSFSSCSPQAVPVPPILGGKLNYALGWNTCSLRKCTVLSSEET